MEAINFEAKRTIDNLVDVEGNNTGFEILEDKIHGDHKIIFYDTSNNVKSPEYEIYGITKEQLASFFNSLSRDTETVLGKGREFDRKEKHLAFLNPVKISKKINSNGKYDLLIRVLEGNEWFVEYEACDISLEDMNKVKGYLKNYILYLDK